MRPLIPAALLLAYACGSSNPEPVSAPTPADSAALARATPHALIAAREQYYDIDGSSAGALRNQINRLGPKDESGESKDALTVWSVESAYAAAQRGDSCVLRDVKVTLDVTVTLPRWKPPGQGDGDVQRDLHIAQDATVSALRRGVGRLDAPHGQGVLRLSALVLGAESVDLIAQRARARSVDVVVLLAGCDERMRRGTSECGGIGRCGRRNRLGIRGAARVRQQQRCRDEGSHAGATLT